MYNNKCTIDSSAELLNIFIILIIRVNRILGWKKGVLSTSQHNFRAAQSLSLMTEQYPTKFFFFFFICVFY